METPACEPVTASPVKTVAFGANCNHTRALCGTEISLIGTVAKGAALGTVGAMVAWSAQKRERKREKAMVSLTAAWLDTSHAPSGPTRTPSVRRVVGGLKAPPFRLPRSAPRFRTVETVSGGKGMGASVICEAVSRH
jgi:hypothetical protein